MRTIAFRMMLFLLPFVGFGQSEALLMYNAQEAFDASRVADAIGLYTKVIALNPSNADAHFQLGKCHYALDAYKEALPNFLKAYELNPSVDPKILKFLGKSSHVNYKFDEAISYYKQYLETLSDTDVVEKQKIEKRIKEGDIAKEMTENPIQVKITNLGQTINSPYDDYSPVISADEQILIFTSRRKGSLGGKKSTIDNSYYEDIYISNKTTGGWTLPRNISNNINTENHDACIGMSPDGRKLLVYKSHHNTKGDIYVSEFKNELWTKPEKMEEQINSEHFEPSASLTADERTIYFSSDKPGGYGGLDLYACYLLPNGKWGPAKNLGPNINTPFDEDAPFIYSDNKTLYFSSNGHETMGGYDILKSTFNPKDSTWSVAQNLRYPINTPNDDIYFNWNYDGTRAYFSSQRDDSEGGKDIYYLERQEANKPIVILKGRLMEKGKETPPPAIIKMTILKNNNENEVIGIFTSNSKRGNYVFSLPGNAKYNLTAEAPGYVYFNEIIDIPATDDFREIVKNIVLEPIQQAVEEKKPMVLNNIYFEYNKALLKEESVVELENIRQLLASNAQLKVEVSGHTDSIGSAKFNQVLSEKRAKAVVDYLVANGIFADRLVSVGYGFTKPIATNLTEEGRKKNRRTEFLLK